MAKIKMSLNQYQLEYLANIPKYKNGELEDFRDQLYSASHSQKFVDVVLTSDEFVQLVEVLDRTAKYYGWDSVLADEALYYKSELVKNKKHIIGGLYDYI